MPKTNGPAREGKAVVCLLGGDGHGYNITPARVQFFARRGISRNRALLLCPIYFGELAA